MEIRGLVRFNMGDLNDNQYRQAVSEKSIFFGRRSLTVSWQPLALGWSSNYEMTNTLRFGHPLISPPRLLADISPRYVPPLSLELLKHKAQTLLVETRLPG